MPSICRCLPTSMTSQACMHSRCGDSPAELGCEVQGQPQRRISREVVLAQGCHKVQRYHVPAPAEQFSL